MRLSSEKVWVGVALLAILLPWLEGAFEVLPVTSAVREDTWLAAMLATLLCVVAGFATARHSLHGFQVGWVALALFMAVLVAMFAVMDLLPRSDQALYIACFALFGLSAASFLSLTRASGAGGESELPQW
jgi:hypothetical protein